MSAGLLRVAGGPFCSDRNFMAMRSEAGAGAVEGARGPFPEACRSEMASMMMSFRSRFSVL